MFPVGFTYTCCLKMLYMHIINTLTNENLLILFHGLGHVCIIYSCFEKGCPTKACATMPKGITGNGVLCP